MPDHLGHRLRVHLLLGQPRHVRAAQVVQAQVVRQPEPAPHASTGVVQAVGPDGLPVASVEHQRLRRPPLTELRALGYQVRGDGVNGLG